MDQTIRPSCIYTDYGGEDHLNCHTAVWLQAKVRDREFGLQPTLYVGSVCDDSAAEVTCGNSGTIYK